MQDKGQLCSRWMAGGTKCKLQILCSHNLDQGHPSPLLLTVGFVHVGGGVLQEMSTCRHRSISKQAEGCTVIGIYPVLQKQGPSLGFLGEKYSHKCVPPHSFAFSFFMETNWKYSSLCQLLGGKNRKGTALNQMFFPLLCKQSLT